MSSSLPSTLSLVFLEDLGLLAFFLLDGSVVGVLGPFTLTSLPALGVFAGCLTIS